MNPLRILICGAFAAALAASWTARVQSSPGISPQDPGSSASKGDPSAAAQHYFTDVTLINQYGQPMRLYSDLLKGRVVVVNAFFTSCQDTCPVMARSLAAIQDWLGDRLGKDVYLISMSVDPETDTPNRLKEYAERFKAKPGWFFLTGKKENMDLALQKLGQYVSVKEDHLNIMIVGKESTGLWKKAMGLAKPADLFKVVESVVNDKGTS